jgi:hypothetical protein
MQSLMMRNFGQHGGEEFVRMEVQMRNIKAVRYGPTSAILLGTTPSNDSKGASAA